MSAKTNIWDLIKNQIDQILFQLSRTKEFLETFICILFSELELHRQGSLLIFYKNKVSMNRFFDPLKWLQNRNLLLVLLITYFIWGNLAIIAI